MMQEKTSVIKLRFVRNGEPSGREYTYFTQEPVDVGDLVDVAIISKGSKSQGVVTAVNVPMAEIEAFKDRAKTIVGKAQQEATESRTEAQDTAEKKLLDV